MSGGSHLFRIADLEPRKVNRNFVLTVQVRISKAAWLRYRLQTALGLQLIKLGAWVSGFRVEIKGR